LLAEASQTVDDVLVLAGGRLVGQGPLHQLLHGAGVNVRVRTPDAARLVSVLQSAGFEAGRARLEGSDIVVVDGAGPEVVGRLMAENRIVVYEMTSTGESLEQLFFQMTEGGEMGSHGPGPPYPGWGPA